MCVKMLESLNDVRLIFLDINRHKIYLLIVIRREMKIIKSILEYRSLP